MSCVHNIIFFSSFITELKNTIETQINEVKQQIEGELDPVSKQKLGALYQWCIKKKCHIYIVLSIEVELIFFSFTRKSVHSHGW